VNGCVQRMQAIVNRRQMIQTMSQDVFGGRMEADVAGSFVIRGVMGSRCSGRTGRFLCWWALSTAMWL